MRQLTEKEFYTYPCENCFANLVIDSRISEYDNPCYNTCERDAGIERLEQERLKIAEAAGIIGCKFQDIGLPKQVPPESLPEKIEFSKKCPAYRYYKTGETHGRQEISA